MRKKGKNIFFILLIILCLAGCGSTSVTTNSNKTVSKEENTVTIGYLPITHALPIFAEKELLEKNKDSKLQIKLQKFSTWPDLMDALNTGKIDGASVLIELAMSAKNKGIGLHAIALGHRDGNAIVVSNQINSIEDLLGKTFAIPSTQSSHNILLQDMLALEYISVDDLDIVQMAPTEMPFSLASGAISGYCVAEPFGAQVVSKQLGHVLYDTTDLWKDSICCVFVLRDTYIEGHKKETQILKERYMEAGNFLSKENAYDIALKYLGQEENTLNQSLQWIHYNELDITKENYDVLCEKLIKYQINEAPPSYDDFVYQQ